jgi:hypothetical protein
MLSLGRQWHTRLQDGSGCLLRMASTVSDLVDFAETTASAGILDSPNRLWRCTRDYSIVGAPNGGYLMAAAARAAAEAVGGAQELQPVAVSAWFLQPAKPVLYSMVPTILKSTKRSSTVMVTASEAESNQNTAQKQDKSAAPSFVVTANVGDPAQVPVPAFVQHHGTAMPALPDPESCGSLLGLYPALSNSDQFPIVHRHDARFDPSYLRRVSSTIGRRAPPESGDGIGPLMDDVDTNYECWIRFPPVPVEATADGAGAIDGHPDKLRVPGPGRKPHRHLDALSLLFFCDCLPPPALLAIAPRFTWVPTIEISVQIRGTPTPGGWLALRHTTRHITGGKLEADCELWDATTGKLVCLSRQFAMLMDPRR